MRLLHRIIWDSNNDISCSFLSRHTVLKMEIISASQNLSCMCLLATFGYRPSNNRKLLGLRFVQLRVAARSISGNERNTNGAGGILGTWENMFCTFGRRGWNQRYYMDSIRVVGLRVFASVRRSLSTDEAASGCRFRLKQARRSRWRGRWRRCLK